MSAYQANCPSCGGGLNFRPGTSVSICEYCSSVVARTDRDLSLMGKVAPLVDTNSPLELGAEGSYDGATFALVGRTQLLHPAGGVWDEWYLAFDDGRWGWLAEAHGEFYLTFEKVSSKALPSFERCQPGNSIDLGMPGRWMVREIGVATVVTAQGELPYYFNPKDSYAYADLSGSTEAFATLDYSDDEPVLYMGREVTLTELRLTARDGYVSSKEKLSTAAISCPNCGGPLELKAPDKAMRVTCQNCDGLLDATQGNLQYLSAIPKIEGRVAIPLGREGMLRGVRYTCVGFMQRYTTIDGIQYYWDEYLLYNPGEGFCWLTENSGHWTFVRAANIAEIFDRQRNVKYREHTYKRFEEAVSVVAAIQGEFYWKVEVGEKVYAIDFIAPPHILSKEASEAGDPGDDGVGAYSSEVNWSFGTYIKGAEVWQAFKLPDSPYPAHGVAPTQPSPYKEALAAILPWAKAFGIALLAMTLAIAFSTGSSPIYKTSYKLPLPPDDSGKQVAFTEAFSIDSSRDMIQVRMSSDVKNTWLGLSGALVNESTGKVQFFGLENSYWYGVDGGYRWSEGSQTATVYLSAMPAGTYVLRLAPEWDKRRRPPTRFEIELKEGGFRWLYLILAIILVGLGPLVLLLLNGSFESRRWQESMFSATG